jgi:hypothetical protein
LHALAVVVESAWPPRFKREERKLEKHLGKLQHQLNGVRAAAKALGDSTSKELKVVKKRVIRRSQGEDW